MHWETAYADKRPTEVSWFQPQPAQSLRLIEESNPGNDAPILDVGAGASMLVDCLLDAGYDDVSILDISGAALREVRERLGSRAADITIIESNVLSFEPQRRYALWHDRAAFHFLTDASERLSYVKLLRQSLQPGGYLVLATFAADGPQRCSGLPVQRYDVQQLETLLGADFVLRSHILHDHSTPSGSVQQFQYSCWQFKGEATTARVE